MFSQMAMEHYSPGDPRVPRMPKGNLEGLLTTGRNLDAFCNPRGHWCDSEYGEWA